MQGKWNTGRAKKRTRLLRASVFVSNGSALYGGEAARRFSIRVPPTLRQRVGAMHTNTRGCRERDSRNVYIAEFLVRQRSRLH